MADQGGIGHLREFDPTTADWSIFKKRMENYFVANNIVDDKRKSAILLNILNEEAYKLLYNLCLPVEPENKTYAELIPLLSEHFKPSVTVFAARYKFYNSRKSASESPKEWAARVKQLAVLCEFENNQLDFVLRDHFIIAYDKGRVQDRLFEEKKSITLKEAVDLAESKSAAQPSSFSSSSGDQQIEVKKEPAVYHPRAKSTHAAEKKPADPTQVVYSQTMSSVNPTAPQISYRQYRIQLLHREQQEGHDRRM
ncbi:hypothetical protein NQ315_015941, partial [Exocentrus adspersus]